MKNIIMATDMEYPSAAQQSIRVLQEDNVRLLKLVQRYSCFSKMFIELCNDIQKDEFFEMEKDYQIILNEIQCSTSESNKKSQLPITFADTADVMQHQIHNYTISNSNINTIGLNAPNNVMDNLPLFDELDMNSQYGYLARAMNQNNMHELFTRPIMNSPTRQLSLDNESLILNQLNIPNQIPMPTFQVESTDFQRSNEENNLIQILRTNQALSQQQQKLYFPLAEPIQQSVQQSPESLVKFTSNPFLNYPDISQQQQHQQQLQQQELSLQASSASSSLQGAEQMMFDPSQPQYDLNSDSNMSMLMRLSSATSSSSSLLQPINARVPSMFVDQPSQLQAQLEQTASQQLQEQQQQQQLIQQIQQVPTPVSSHSGQITNGQLLEESRVQLLDQPRVQLLEQPRAQHLEQPRVQILEQPRAQLLEQPRAQLLEQPLPLHKPRESVQIYQPNDETLDLSQNMTAGIYLHRRKRRLNNNNDSNTNNNNNNTTTPNKNNSNLSNGSAQPTIVSGEKAELERPQSAHTQPVTTQLLSHSSTPLDARIDSLIQNDLQLLKSDSPPPGIDLRKSDNFYDDCIYKENGGVVKFGTIACTFPDCDELFVDQMALSIHMKRKHAIVRPFKCKFEGCKAEFKELHKLKVHGVVHTKDKPFKCDFPGCDARFSQSGHVSRHKKNHIQETNYMCTWEGCNKQFKQKHNLKIHLINHRGGEKPWACDVKGCNRAFVEKWKLKKHVKTHLRLAQRE